MFHSFVVTKVSITKTNGTFHVFRRVFLQQHFEFESEDFENIDLNFSSSYLTIVDKQVTGPFLSRNEKEYNSQELKRFAGPPKAFLAYEESFGFPFENEAENSLEKINANLYQRPSRIPIYAN